MNHLQNGLEKMLYYTSYRRSARKSRLRRSHSGRRSRNKPALSSVGSSLDFSIMHGSHVLVSLLQIIERKLAHVA
jgi:hypothetical protein